MQLKSVLICSVSLCLPVKWSLPRHHKTGGAEWQHCGQRHEFRLRPEGRTDADHRSAGTRDDHDLYHGGLIATIKDAQNNVTTYGYDAHGNRTSVTDALQNQ